MVAKRFFYVCAGLLCLALAYHLGARSASGQANNTAAEPLRPLGAPGDTARGSGADGLVGIAASSCCVYVATRNGDLYMLPPESEVASLQAYRRKHDGTYPGAVRDWLFLSNVFEAMGLRGRGDDGNRKNNAK